MTEIKGYHAHVYFDAETVETATRLCKAVSKRFSVAMGRVHEKPVGPHTMWSCQLSLSPEQFGTVIPWMSLNRQGLTVFVHPETGDHLADHRDHVIWLGNSVPLNLEMFGSQSI